MDAIKKFKEHTGKLTTALAGVRDEIFRVRNLINDLDSSPLPPLEMPGVLTRMVDAAAARFLEFIQTEGIPEVMGASIEDLNYSADDTKPLDRLFLDRNAFDDTIGRTIPGAVMRPDALCYFFGDAIKTGLATACAGMANDDDGEAIQTGMVQRLEDLQKARAKLKALELQEEEIEAALEEARDAFDSMDGY